MSQPGDNAREGFEGPHFELVVNEELAGFESVIITSERYAEDGYPIPEEVTVVFPDGTELEQVSVNERVFTLRALHRVHGVDIIVPIERAHHIKHLHIDGEDSGSRFLEGSTLESLLADLCEVLPLEASEGNYRKQAFDLDMERDYGWENLGTLEELVEQEVISGYDVRLMGQHWKDIMHINLDGDDEEKVDFVSWFNGKYKQDNIFLRMVRPPGNVVLPHAVGPPHLTSRVMTALSTRHQEGVKKMHTLTPGRAMGRHPMPGEHRDHMRGKVNMKSFRSSSWAWTHSLLLVPTRELESPANLEAGLDLAG